MLRLKYFEKNRHATWLELFFDLVFVACVGTLSHDLGHIVTHGFAWAEVLHFLSGFLPIWWIWASHTYYSNRFDTDTKPHRLVTLLIVLLTATMSAYLGGETGTGHSWFMCLYPMIRLLQATMYLNSGRKHDNTKSYTRSMGLLIIGTALISTSALLFDSEVKYYVFLLGILLDMTGTAYVTRKKLALPVHLPHLVERVGLLSLILLGESVISLAAGLRGIIWNPYNAAAAFTGFVMTCAIWWIYFDSFNVLERAKRIKNGFELLYSHAVFCLGLVILATLIRHAINNELAPQEFQYLAIVGMTFFYLGKQTVYFVAFPVFRINNIVNSIVCISVTVASTFLPRAEYALMGMTIGMLFYVYSNLTWTLIKDASPYLRE